MYRYKSKARSFQNQSLSVGNKFTRVDYSLTFGVDERRTERPLEDPVLEGDVRVVLGVMLDAEPDFDVKGPSPAGWGSEPGAGEVSIPCRESRCFCLSRPLDVVPSLTWYLLARDGFGLLALDDIVRALFYYLQLLSAGGAT